MQTIRSDLPIQMDNAREKVNNLTDWKYYVRSYPAIVVPVVAALAYALVPTRKSEPSDQVAYLDREDGIQRVRLVQDQIPKKSIVSGLVSAALTLALRSGSTLATRRISQMLHNPEPTSASRGL
tara:strand:+ start:76351 stop:76722 length:372 start_codon:yes stop_codon:yes gene_type:complete